MVMRLNRSMVGWCLCLLMVSMEDATANSSLVGLTELLPAAALRLDVVSRPSPIPAVWPVMKVAQNAPDRKNGRPPVPNTAGVSLQMSPEQSVSVGTKISFRVRTKKPGYVLLVDIDANGKMSQIFPSPEMIVQSKEAATNFIKPGEELLIPNAAAQKSGFEYVMAPPTGEAAVVAILSDRRVQILDLPDNGPKQRTEAEMISYLAAWTSELRIPDPGTGEMQPSNWSFDIKPYSIRE